MSRHDTHYREWTSWPPWVEVTVSGCLLLASAAMLAGWETDLSPGPRALIATGFLAFGFGLWKVAGGLAVRLDESGVFLHLGSVPLFRRRIPFDEILEVEVVRCRPLRDFGGWGIQGLGNTKAWMVRGDRAVLLRLTDGRELYVGSDVPQRLAERIRTLGAGRFALPAGDG